MGKLKKAILVQFVVGCLSLLLTGCHSQEQAVKLEDPLYQNEKCYYEAISSQPSHIPTQIESEIRYNRCRRN